MSCIFCMLANGQIPTNVVYESENTIAILDLSQANEGHTLVLPKKHFDTLLDVNIDILKEMMETTQIVAKAIDKAFSPDGINILNNTREAAGQSVMHAHIHIIPRFKDDNLKFEFVNNEGKFDLDAIKNKIKENL